MRPVSVCVALTEAPCTTAPLESTTVPRMLAVICCAAAFRPANIATSKHRTFLKLAIDFLAVVLLNVAAGTHRGGIRREVCNISYPAKSLPIMDGLRLGSNHMKVLPELWRKTCRNYATWGGQKIKLRETVYMFAFFNRVADFSVFLPKLSDDGETDPAACGLK